MDKIREEFEAAWATSRDSDDGVAGNKPTRSRINHDEYAGEAAQFAWMWWQRSRASLCVELPNNLDGEYYADGWNACLLAVGDKIEGAGVSYK